MVTLNDTVSYRYQNIMCCDLILFCHYMNNLIFTGLPTNTVGQCQRSFIYLFFGKDFIYLFDGDYKEA